MISHTLAIYYHFIIVRSIETIETIDYCSSSSYLKITS